VVHDIWENSIDCKLNLDYLSAVRTAPYHSYRNLVERIMSVFNIGLQAIALARKEMPQEMEVEKCSSMKALRAVAKRNPSFREASLDSIAPVKIVLTNRLELKGKKFSTFAATSAQQLGDLWTALLTIDEEFSYSRKDKFSSKELSQKLINCKEHSCTQRHYFFDIIKCGETDCDICLPPRLPPDA